MQPAVGVDGVRRGLGVVEVPLHDVRAPHPDLAGVALLDVVARRHVDDAALAARHHPADRAGLPAALEGDVGGWAGLGHAVALEDLDVETGGDLIGEFGAQRRRARDDRLEGG